MSNFVAYLPGLLESADAFVSGDHGDPELAASRYLALVKEQFCWLLLQLATSASEPSRAGPSRDVCDL